MLHTTSRYSPASRASVPSFSLNRSSSCFNFSSALCCDYCQHQFEKHVEVKLIEILETLKVGLGYATCQFVVSGWVFFFSFGSTRGLFLSRRTAIRPAAVMWCQRPEHQLLREITQLTSPTLCFTQHTGRFSLTFSHLPCHHLLLLSLLRRRFSPLPTISAPPVVSPNLSDLNKWPGLS